MIVARCTPTVGALGSAAAVLLALLSPPASALPPLEFPQACPAVLTASKAKVTHTLNRCTQQTLQTAMRAGGVLDVRQCGKQRVKITRALQMPKRKDVTIIANGLILDGGDQNRLIEFNNPGFRHSNQRLRVENMTFENGRAPFGEFKPQRTGLAERCAWGYKDGRGGAIFVNNGILEVLNSRFINNRGAPKGPEAGGGAIYASGSKGVTVQGSTFDGNHGANAGAIGVLQTDTDIVNSVFRNNRATGEGGNAASHHDPALYKLCGLFNHEGQLYAGGLAGAVGVDGFAPDKTRFCGITCTGNTANSPGGCINYTGNRTKKRKLEVLNSLIADNVSQDVGGGVRAQEADVIIKNSLISNNTAGSLGGGLSLGWNQRPEVKTTLKVDNSVIRDNQASRGGGISGDIVGTVTDTYLIGNRMLASAKIQHTPQIFGGGFTMVRGGVFGHTGQPCRSIKRKSPRPTLAVKGQNSRQWPKGPTCAKGFRFAPMTEAEKAQFDWAATRDSTIVATPAKPQPKPKPKPQPKPDRPISQAPPATEGQSIDPFVLRHFCAQPYPGQTQIVEHVLLAGGVWFSREQCPGG